MPLYDFECESCKHCFEDICSTDAPPPPCPECASEKTRKLMSCATIHFEPVSPLDRGIAPITGYNPTGRKPSCPHGGCKGSS